MTSENLNPHRGSEPVIGLRAYINVGWRYSACVLPPRPC
jgi:hypothetical protein